MRSRMSATRSPRWRSAAFSMARHAGQRAEFPDHVGDGRQLVIRRQGVVIPLAEDPAIDDHHEQLGHPLHVVAQHHHDVEQFGKRHTVLHEFSAGVHHARRVGLEALAVGHQHAQPGGLGQGQGVGGLAKQFHQLRHAEIARRLVGPGRAHRRRDAQQAVQRPALGLGGQQFGDVRDGVATLEQVVDQLEAGAVHIAVDAAAAPALGWRQDATVLIGPNVAHRGVGQA